ncbi:MAG: hypothetical protein WCV90_01445 [Candidatus Woesearchaeota archaeon]
MLRKLSALALASYLALAQPLQAEPRYSSDLSHSLSHPAPVVKVKKKEPIRQLFDFLEGCRASTEVKRELSHSTLTDTTFPLLGGLEVMLDTQMISGRKIVPRTGVRYYLKTDFVRLYVQGVVDLQDKYRQELLTSARFSHRFDKKYGVNLDLNRLDSFGRERLSVNQFRFGVNYKDLELGVGGDVSKGISYGYNAAWSVKYYF